jgi:hypothetical protein
VPHAGCSERDRCASVWRDAGAFDRAGLPTAVVIQDPLYGARPNHTNMDLFDYVVDDDPKQSAALMAWVLYRAANEP